MAVVSSLSGAQSVVQEGFRQLKVLEARRSADQAERVALSLQSQARNAQQVADRAQETARDLGVQSNQALETAGRARQGVAFLDSSGQALQRLGQFVSQVAERQEVPAKAAESGSGATTGPVGSAAPPSPVVNAQGQLTGTLVSTTA